MYKYVITILLLCLSYPIHSWAQIAIGDKFVQRHDAVRASTANGTAAYLSYDTPVYSEGGYSWSSPDVTVDTAGLYLYIGDIGQADLASTRAVGTLTPHVNSAAVNDAFYASTRYLRNSGGSQQGASIGIHFLELSASDDVSVRVPGTVGTATIDAIGNYGTNAGAGGALQLIRFNDGDFLSIIRESDAAEVGTSNINTTRPWIDSSGTWAKITYTSETSDDGAWYPGTGGDVTLPANSKFAIAWGATPYSTDTSRHTYVTALNVAGTRRQTASGYHRNTASQGPAHPGLYFYETGGSSVTVFLEATHEIEGGDAGTPNISAAYLQVVELPSTAEWIHADNGATDSMTTALAGLTTWYDTPLSSTQRTDGNSNLSLDAANNAIQNDSGGTISALAVAWHRWDRDTISSGTRKNPWSEFELNGSRLGYGIAGAFSRGQQATDDTWQAHYVAAVAVDIPDTQDLKFQAQDEASAANSDIGIYASTSRHFLGMQVLDLSTLDAAAPAPQTQVIIISEAANDNEWLQVADAGR